jgi:methionine sulfoxide reductase catalytic subunit
MIIKVKTSADIPSSEITPEPVYHSRREFMRTAAVGAVGLAAGGALLGGAEAEAAQTGADLPPAKKSPLSVTDKPHTWEQITNYNNFYEFGTNKSDPAQNSGQFKPRPWTVKVDGLVGKPADYAIDDLIKMNQLEERVYRHRCVEAWSMVIPWTGIPLADILKKVEPTSAAKFVEFTSVTRPAEMPGQRARNLPYPYVEGLRLDEAMHPLTLAVVGLYGKVLPNPNGAPLRIHIPWKYGFKSGKSIVRIRLTDKEPKNTWQIMAADEYGFYANVNPDVDHPRWSQRTERVIGGLFNANKPTVKFNGYGDQVASLYAGMDLKKNF